MHKFHKQASTSECSNFPYCKVHKQLPLGKQLSISMSKNSNNGTKPSGEIKTSIELFCGIGGFRIAADAVGIKTVWANDIEPKACHVYRNRFGEPLKEGDIHAFIEDVPPHDLLSGGFPCQPFSSAGKKLGVRDPRGTLFQFFRSFHGADREEHLQGNHVTGRNASRRGCNTHFPAFLASPNPDAPLETCFRNSWCTQSTTSPAKDDSYKR